jgi:hypothetical protein
VPCDLGRPARTRPIARPCGTDAIEQVALGDDTERVIVAGNVFADITAHGADLDACT